MLTTFRQSFKTLVQAKNDETPVGLLVDMVVNPNTGVFEALWVKSIEGSKLLLPKDILFWDSEQITINDNNDLATPESLPRLAKIFEQECPILKSTVHDQALNKNIGRVRDFTFDTISPRLLALEVQNGFLGINKQRIPQHHILRIEPRCIVVDSLALKGDQAENLVSKKITRLEVPELDGPRRKEK